MNHSRRGFLFGLVGAGTGAGLVLGKTHHEAATSATCLDPHYVTVYSKPGKSCGEASVERIHGGELAVSFRLGAPGSDTGEIVLVRSRDQGRTWAGSKAVTVFSCNGRNGGKRGYHLGRVTQLSDGCLVSVAAEFRFLFANSIAWRRGTEIEGVYISRSFDGGRSWTNKSRVNIEPFYVAWVRGAISEMPDGTLLLPLSGLKGSRYFPFDEPVSSFLLRSNDRGLTWRYHAMLAQDPSRVRDYDEAQILRLCDGRLLAVLRSHPKPERDPLGGYLHFTYSEDGGDSWSPPVESMLWGYPADLIQLQDGRVFCTYSYRMFPNPGIRGCISEDGMTWAADKIFAIKSVPNSGPENLLVGSPATLEVDKGLFLTVYHLCHRPEDSDGSTESATQSIEGALYHLPSGHPLVASRRLNPRI